MSPLERELLGYLISYSVRHNASPPAEAMLVAGNFATYADLYVVLEALVATGSVKAEVLALPELTGVSNAELALARLRARLARLTLDVELAEHRALELAPEPGTTPESTDEALAARAFARGIRVALDQIAAAIEG